MKTRIAPLLLAALVLTPLWPAPAPATNPIAEVLCEPRDRLAARLAGQGAMRPVGQGLRDPGTVLEIWATPDGRWTLIQAQADGLACILAMGEGWDMPPARAPA
jgi:hypothetical protein